MKKTNMTTIRFATNAVLMAVYVVLAFLAIQIGGLKITFEHFPVVLCAVLFGPVDAMLVGGLGELINQLMTFGITPTTALWILPIVFRGFAVGMCTIAFKNRMRPESIMKQKIPFVFMIVCIISGICASGLNTLALYVDSRMFGYYSYALVFGSLALRIISGVITSVVIGLATKPLLHALFKTDLIQKRK